MRRETFAQARDRILAYLTHRGWDVKTRGPSGPLKVPHATAPNYERTRVWFKAQAVYIGHGITDMGSARSLWVDIRGMPTSEFERIALADGGRSSGDRRRARKKPAARDCYGLHFHGSRAPARDSSRKKHVPFEKGDRVRGPGISGTGTVLNVAFLGHVQHHAAYHVRDDRGVIQTIWDTEMRRVRKASHDAKRYGHQGPKTRAKISRKIRLLRREGRSAGQSAAIAYRMYARKARKRSPR